MAGCARRPRLLAMSLVAGKATKAFVDTHGGAIVTRTGLLVNQRSVTLVAERLARVGTDFDQPVAVLHRWQRQLRECHIVEFALVKKRYRSGRDLLVWSGSG